MLSKNSILTSVEKTGRLVTVDEGYESGGTGSESMAIVMRKRAGLKVLAVTIASPNAPCSAAQHLKIAI